MSTSSQQKSLVLERKQGPLVVISTEIPEPAAGQIQVRIEATGLNPLDWKIQAWGIFRDTFPAFLGADAAGVVTKLGEGVKSLAVGDKVFYEGGATAQLATFQQYNVIDADLVAKIPSNITFEQASAIPVVFGTASFGLSKASVPPVWEDGARGKFSGQPIFVLGGSTSIGQFVIQLAKHSGFSPIIVTASPHNETYLKSLGATHVLDRKLSASEIKTEISKITQKPIKLVYDTVSAPETQEAGYHVLASGGTILLVLPSSLGDKTEAVKEIISVVADLHAPEARDFGRGLFKHISDLLESGEVKPLPVEVLPGGLNGIQSGLDRLKSGSVSATKLVALPQQTA